MKSRAALLILLLAFGGATAAIAGGDPRAEKLRPNRHDMALARRLTLNGRDVTADWRRLRAPASPDSSSGCRRFRSDLSAFTITGKARSLFVSGDRRSGIVSSVAVFRSRSDAILDFLSSAKPQLIRCVASSVLSSSRRFLRRARRRGFSRRGFSRRRQSGIERPATASWSSCAGRQAA